MPNEFLQQFMAGWQMGQGRNESMRRNQELQMEQQRQAQAAQERAQHFALQQEEFKLRKKQLEAEELASKLNAAKEAYGLKTQAAALPPATAAQQGIAPQAPEMGGPPPDQIMTRDVQMMPDPSGQSRGIPFPILSGVEQETMRRQRADEEARAKIAEIFGVESARMQARSPFEAEKAQREHALKLKEINARIAGARSVVGGAGGRGGGTQDERTKAEVAQYALSQMPQWQEFVKNNEASFGPIAGRITKFKQSGLGRPLGMKPDPKVAKAEAEFSVMSNAMINALSGAAVSEQEFERLKKQIPLFTDDPVVVNAKMSVLSDFFKFRLTNMNQPWNGPGWESRQNPQNPQDPAATIAPMIINGVELIQEE